MYSATIQLIKRVDTTDLKDWLDEACPCDLTAKAGMAQARVLNVIITGSTRADVEASAEHLTR